MSLRKLSEKNQNKMKTLLLIDAHAMIHRAFHALPKEFISRKGIPTNAIYGFFLMLQKVISDFKPTHIAVCFDTPKPTFRKKLFKDYQGKRPPMDDTLKPQIPIIEEMLNDGKIATLKKPGFEADDVIGTLANDYRKEFDRILILSGDRDLLQLINNKVFMITPKRGVSDFTLYDEEIVKEKFGVSPKKIPDYKALAGDSSDNYNTARGIGPKTATKLLHQFKTIENLLKNSKEIENEKWKKIIEEHKDQIELFKKIATIVKNLDLDHDINSLEYNGFDDKMKKQLNELDLHSLLKKLYNKINPNNIKKKVKEKKTNSQPKDQINLF